MKSETNHWWVAQQLIGHESLCLDTRAWDDWLSLYLADAEYWIPAWRTDGTLVEDPKNELSLIYYPNRVGLEARIFRIRTNRASSYSLAARTNHVAQIVSVDSQGNGDLLVRSHWTASTVLDGRTAMYYGHALYTLRQTEEGWRIARKVTVIHNDMIHEVVDIYSV